MFCSQRWQAIIVADSGPMHHDEAIDRSLQNKYNFLIKMIPKAQKMTAQHPDNKVLENGYKKSQNFFESDWILRHYLVKNSSKEGWAYMLDKWERLGGQAATEMDKLSMLADKNIPVLYKRNVLGEDVNEIEFHPAYERLKEIAVTSEMFRVKWHPPLKKQFQNERHTLGFAAGYLYVMAEDGLYCPLCMTDGVARIIDRYSEDGDRERLLKRIATDDVENLFTGAMFLTEKTGGSDVGANLVSADYEEDGYYRLNGEKWFCSNANAELILALARTNAAIKGTKGLSIFLIEKEKPNGEKNPKNIIRLKDKIGVRSMASAEIILEDTLGKLIGEEGQGFRVMTDMINLSRLYNSVTASGIIRRVLIEAYQYLSYRKTFGKIALEHSLVRDKLAELAALHQANFYLTWRTIRALDAADNGDEKAGHLVRLLTPMLKKETAFDAVYACRESMEAIGGIAYIEENVIPKFLRDSLVLPIWEGASNIMILDMLRATFKSQGLTVLFEEIHQILDSVEDVLLQNKAKELLQVSTDFASLSPDDLQLQAKPFFEQLANLYKVSLLYQNKDEESQKWIDPAIAYLKQHYFEKDKLQKQNYTTATIIDMIAWDF